jgi:alkylation response protein AidB-like acyl-CoA dehydrogenase
MSRASGEQSGLVSGDGQTPELAHVAGPDTGRSGLVAAGWEVRFGGLGWQRETAVAVEQVTARYHLPRLNPLGLNIAAPALFAHGTQEQRLRQAVAGVAVQLIGYLPGSQQKGS